MKDLERLGQTLGKGVMVLGIVLGVFSLARLDGTGLGVGVMLLLYGLGLTLLAGVYGELRAVRAALERPEHRKGEELAR
jgi:hypothetical protein